MRFLPIALFLSVVTIPAAAQVHQPDGSGDPAATTCMIGDKPTGSLLPRRICYTNARWAALKAQYIAIGPDGRAFLTADAPLGTQIIGLDGKPLLKADDPRNIRFKSCTTRDHNDTVDCNSQY